MSDYATTECLFRIYVNSSLTHTHHDSAYLSVSLSVCVPVCLCIYLSDLGLSDQLYLVENYVCNGIEEGSR